MYNMANDINYKDIYSNYIPLTKQYQNHLYDMLIITNKTDLMP